MHSLWQEVKKPSFSSLNNDLNVDILIVGGGLSGVMSAYYLNDSFFKVALVEASEIGHGTTGYTTGKLNVMQGNTYNELLNNFGFKKAYQYLNSQLYGLNLVIQNAKDIDCDLQETESYIFTNNKENISKINQLYHFFAKAQYKVATSSNLPIDYPCIYALKANSYTFHPLKYLYGMVNKLKCPVYEHTSIISFVKKDDYYIVKTNKNEIKAKYLIFASGYPFFINPGLMPLKLSTYKSYALSARSIDAGFDAISIDKILISIRYYKNNIIFGGFSHQTTDIDNSYENLLKNFQKHFDLKPEFIWSTSDVKTNDLLSFIGHVNDNIYIITGFNKWGMINSTLAGKIISDLITKGQNEYASLFEFHRRLSIEKVKSFFTDTLSIGKRYIQDKLKRKKSFYKNVEIKKISDIVYGVYTDNQGIKHYAKNNCPHLSCTLIFNKNDLSWDCPCHASKFDIDGNVIKGPSNKSIKE